MSAWIEVGGVRWTLYGGPIDGGKGYAQWGAYSRAIDATVTVSGPMLCVEHGPRFARFLIREIVDAMKNGA